LPRSRTLAITLAALVATAPASAHVEIAPPYIAARDTANLRLTGPNERDEPMTGFSVTVRHDFRIVAARSAAGWLGEVRGARAIWRGGSLAPEAEATFTLEVEAPSGPGPAQLEAVQRYPGGDVVTWDVGLTVTPEPEASSQNLGLAVLTAVVGLVVLSAFGVAVLRRARSLQEK